MGQKVNPHGLRVGVIKNWDSRWFASDEKFGDTLVQDYKVREFLKKKLFLAGIPKIEIERDNTGKVRVFIHCAKPGMVIGRGGSEIDNLKADIEKIVNAPVIVNVVEVKPVEMDAQLVAESIANQLERRISFRRAMKGAIQRTEHYHEGTIPLQTIRADIDYGFWEANTTYGKIGVKVWIYKGEILSEVARTGAVTEDRRNNNQRRDRRDGQRRDRRDGDRRNGGDRREGGFQRRDGQGPRGNRPAQPESRPPRAPRKTEEGGAH